MHVCCGCARSNPKHLITLVLAGMKCGGCVGHVKRVLEEHESVTEVRYVEWCVVVRAA